METTVDTSNPAYRHGHAGKAKFSPTYHSWASMLQRATNPKRPYAKHYVLKGIGVCEAWLEFDSFLADMGVRPSGTTLDRIDPSKGYSPENCRWATPDQQANNKSSSRMATINGVTQSVTAWCRELGVSRNTVWARIHQWGYSAEDALTRPKQDRVASAIEMTRKRISRKD